MLAGVIKAPAHYSPYLDAKAPSCDATPCWGR